MLFFPVVPADLKSAGTEVNGVAHLQLAIFRKELDANTLQIVVNRRCNIFRHTCSSRMAFYGL